MAIKLDMLKCFAAVAQHGSLADAADALGRTPSAVSMMLKQFEDHVGTPLFETARKSRLTAVGTIIYEEARREVSHFENTVSIIEGVSRSEIGYLRLAVTPSVASSVLPPIIKDFVSEHPQVQIDIRDMDSAAITHELRRERVDMGIGSLPEIEGLNRQELFSDAFGVVCRKDSVLARDWGSLSWKAMHKETLITNGLCEMITEPEFAPILANSRLKVLNTSSLLGLVKADVGFTVLPQMAVSELHDELAFLPMTDVSARRAVHMMMPRTHLLMPAAKAFIDRVLKMKKSGALLSGR
ncbi:MAG: LysR family transcriptional regulator [Paracoccaceae bacterium]|nr:LysR family transcriptional regulator [Paracoccaceae bacterium]MDG1737656.1 LysR family transcriptional regulator [Paracoccaceae bacterium]MDG2257665.1 LysR family transcriptional regulator [Paracoccaceae bacterium]